MFLSCKEWGLNFWERIWLGLHSVVIMLGFSATPAVGLELGLAGAKGDRSSLEMNEFSES